MFSYSNMPILGLLLFIFIFVFIRIVPFDEHEGKLHGCVVFSTAAVCTDIGFHFLFPPLSIGLSWLWSLWKVLDGGEMMMCMSVWGNLSAKFSADISVGVATESSWNFNSARTGSVLKICGDIFGAPLPQKQYSLFSLNPDF